MGSRRRRRLSRQQHFPETRPTPRPQFLSQFRFLLFPLQTQGLLQDIGSGLRCHRRCYSLQLHSSCSEMAPGQAERPGCCHVTLSRYKRGLSGNQNHQKKLESIVLKFEEPWVVKSQEEHKLTGMEILWWMSSSRYTHARKDKIGDKCIREKVGVAPIEEKMTIVPKKKMTKSCIRWIGLVMRGPIEAIARRP